MYNGFELMSGMKMLEGHFGFERALLVYRLCSMFFCCHFCLNATTVVRNGDAHRAIGDIRRAVSLLAGLDLTMKYFNYVPRWFLHERLVLLATIWLVAYQAGWHDAASPALAQTKT
eukprot:Selendium_serpulae@DN9148_c0_g1_i1.p2